MCSPYIENMNISYIGNQIITNVNDKLPFGLSKLIKIKQIGG